MFVELKAKKLLYGKEDVSFKRIICNVQHVRSWIFVP